MALEWLDEIEARANAATPGPWRPVYEDAFNPAKDDELDKRDAYWVAGPDYVERTYDGYSFWNEADAEFVAAAREDIPRLCRAVRELYEAALKSANAASAAMSYWPDEEQVYEVLERLGHGGGSA